MSEILPHGYIIDIHFDSDFELKKAFSTLHQLLTESEWIFELNLRLHWQKSTLNIDHVRICQELTETLRQKDQHLNIFFKLPFCIGENSKYATFPNCGECVFLESGWCMYPRQMGHNYYNVPQKDFSPDQIDQFGRNDFEGSIPLTWYYPQRFHMALAAHQLGLSPVVIDFGSGNGFVTTLLAREIQKQSQIYAVEPNVKVNYEVSGIRNVTALPSDLPEDWSLFSSLADFYVPLEICMKARTLPRDIVMIVFPDVFGFGGERREYVLRGQDIVSHSCRSLFDRKTLGALGYQMIYRDQIESHFYENTEFVIYSRKDQKIQYPKSLDQLAPYAWESGENSSFSKKSAISTLDLS